MTIVINMLSFLIFPAFVILTSLTQRTALTGEYFEAELSDTDSSSFLCYTGSINLVKSARSTLQCALFCSGDERCRVFNFKLNSSQCEMLYTIPYRLHTQAQADCRAYKKTLRNGIPHCESVEFTPYNKQTVPDNIPFQCPVYSDYPATGDKKKPVRINLALGRPSYVSSLFNNSYFATCNGVDGNANEVGTCILTNDAAGKPNWYLIDLQSIYRIEQVVVTNRLLINADYKLDWFYVGLLKAFTPGMNFTRGNYPLCGQFLGLSMGKFKLNVTCVYEKLGRFVLIQQIARLSYMNLCEVEVFGNYPDCYHDESTIEFNSVTYPDGQNFTCPVDLKYPNISNPVRINVALGRPVFAATIENINNIPCHVTDGNANANANFPQGGSCYKSMVETNSAPNWLYVDLQSIYNVERVVVHNRLDAYDGNLENFLVGIIYDLQNASQQLVRSALPIFGQFFGSSASLAVLEVTRDEGLEHLGRYVAVTTARYINLLNFCELEVHGTPATAEELKPMVFNNLTFPDNLPLICPIYPGYPNLYNRVKPNLAIGRRVYTSSNYGADGCSQPCHLVDGNAHGEYYITKTCFNYVDTDKLWIVIDLASNYKLEKFIVSNMLYLPSDGRPFDANTNYIIAGVLRKYTPNANVLLGTYQICGQYPRLTKGIIKLVIKCGDYGDTVGRYAVIQHVDRIRPIILCEVAVFGQPVPANFTSNPFTNLTYPDNLPFTCPLYQGYPQQIEHAVPVNLALGRPAYASSTWPDLISKPCNAVDGNGSGQYGDNSCVKLKDPVGGFNHLVVDLQADYKVARVVISNREPETFLLSDLYVGILPSYVPGTNVMRGTYPLCGRFSGSSAGKMKFKVTCDEMSPVGRYIIIQQNETMQNMNICELEVYA